VPGHAGETGSVFFNGNYGNAVGSTTLSADAAENATTVTLTSVAGITAATLTSRGTRFYICTQGKAQLYSFECRLLAGNVVTLDVPLPRAFLAAEAVVKIIATADQCNRVKLSGWTIRGTGDKGVELICAWDCRLKDLNIEAGALTLMGASFDVGGRNNTYENCVVDAAADLAGAGCQQALAFEYNVGSRVLGGRVHGALTANVLITGCDSWAVENVDIAGGQRGVLVTTNHTRDFRGSKNGHITGCRFVGCTTTAVQFDSGSHDNVVTQCTGVGSYSLVVSLASNPTHGPIAGPGATGLSVLALVGGTTSNTDLWQLYFKVTVGGGNATVSLYKDAAYANLVAEGTKVGNGAGSITLTAQNASGLSGTVVSAGALVSSTDAANVMIYPDVRVAVDNSVVECKAYNATKAVMAGEGPSRLLVKGLRSVDATGNHVYAINGSIVTIDGGYYLDSGASGVLTADIGALLASAGATLRIQGRCIIESQRTIAGNFVAIQGTGTATSIDVDGCTIVRPGVSPTVGIWLSETATIKIRNFTQSGGSTGLYNFGTGLVWRLDNVEYIGTNTPEFPVPADNTGVNHGKMALTAGTCTFRFAGCTTAHRVRLTKVLAGGTAGIVAAVAGAGSVVLTSSNAADTSTFRIEVLSP
jgi:hypothetical protein